MVAQHCGCSARSRRGDWAPCADPQTVARGPPRHVAATKLAGTDRAPQAQPPPGEPPNPRATADGSWLKTAAAATGAADMSQRAGAAAEAATGRRNCRSV